MLAQTFTTVFTVFALVFVTGSMLILLFVYGRK